ncbi:LPS-assembly protein LptD [Paracoccus fistulariae]|uniref:LPS-assembly protein LptD n=1 Tax=Paracoccus fistulariae TaxID=658446 RepID=A0ABY7SH27_9RHOB|nr:LPS assembly protein LptD [Paracoccus fistulariae]MDB6181853.1 LPS assembly protein LptD [Paracoccus fistulariae]WCR05858.1 LPS-assembly protein LptD [Paracoccus fistulariae]
MTRRGQKGWRYSVGIAGLALVPGLALAQDVMPEDPGLGAGSVVQSTDLNWSGEPALAPAATSLSDTVINDGTPEAASLESAAPMSRVTISNRPTVGDTGDSATVLADSMTLQGDRTLIAAGGVVVWYQGARLVASRIIVDGASGDLTIEGPIHLSEPGAADPDKEAIIIADSGQLDRELQDGIIRGARLVIARELQLAAQELTRTGNGRMTNLTNVVASSCQICASDPTPLWEIRARRISHDAETRLITFDRPQFRFYGVPLASVPFTVTAPDPTVERRSGFLLPSIRTTSNLGFGVKVPYFITLGDSADLTLTPYLSTSRTSTLELRYRQAWRNAVTEWNGAISRDDIEPDDTRGYLFGNALVDLPRDYQLGVQVQVASDRSYLLDYDVTDADRLWSGLTLARVTRDKLVFARVGNYHSLREDEDNRTSPAQVADAFWLRRFTPDWIGGEALLEWSAHAHRRPSDQDIVGRDMARGSFGLDWRRTEILPGGLVGAAIAGLDADVYRITQDSEYDDIVTRVDPQLGVELRWPLAGSDGTATYMLEPIAQLLWSPRGKDENDIPNEDSRLIEFDEGNLFSDNRFPGYDARETGLRANIGMSWTRIDPAGWSLGLTGGRVFRDRVEKAFGEDSPLYGRRSDWLLAANYASGDGLAIVNRALFDDSLDVSRNELRLGWLRPDLQLSAGHLWINGDKDEGREDDISEFTGKVGWQITDGWWGSAETRYDFVADSAQSASLDVTYRNECITVDLGIERRFTSSESIQAETSVGFSVRLGGFGSQKDGPGTVARRSCVR